MTDPYQQHPTDGPQYGVPGTGPGQPHDAYAQPADPYGQQQFPPPPYGQPYGYPPAPYGPPGMDPQAPYGRNVYGEPYSDKSKLAAGLLQIFLGFFGVGRFYLGYTGLGVAQLVVSILTCGVGHIWGLIDGIMILAGKVRDPDGRPLQD
ncbi:TM2 domain-containing protein [Nocardia terpenica]|uniref:TM2 domain-containing protein n=1 Tax=Nocardia terpenica TaxID=455432 RepID=UPI0018E072B6|nr:TM2 domain-containing protein [Nocardia terpenica]